MAKSIKKVMLVMSIVIILSAQAAFAQTAGNETTLTLFLNQTSMEVEKAGVQSVITLDVPASAPRGTTLVPVRAVLEAFDAVLSYDSAARQVHITKGATAITLTIDSKIAVVNGKQTTLLEPAVLENNRTLVPIRFISESLGYKVGWEDATKKITISNSGTGLDSDFVYTQPEEKKSELYNAIKKGIEDFDTKIDVSKYISRSTTSDEVFNVYEDVVDENPELFYSGSRVEYSSNGIVYPTYAVPVAQIPDMKKAFDAKVEEITESVLKPRMTEYERELALHDYLVNNAKYDSAGLSSGNNIWYDHSAYGVLIKGTGVCDSYAKAMSLLARKAGLDCRFVTGNADSFGTWGPHAWNIIRISGKYYHLDVTFDDPVTKSGDTLTHNYFNLTDKEISADHKMDDSSKYPKCDSSEYNYYVVNGMKVDSYEEFYNKIESAVKAGEKQISIKITNFDGNKYNVPNTMERIWRSNSYKSIRYAYSIDDNQGIINIVNIELSK